MHFSVKETLILPPRSPRNAEAAAKEEGAVPGGKKL